MLAFARKQELAPGAIDLGSLVHGIEELLQRSLGPGISIETEFPDKLEAIEADANQLELSILNLAVNARDAMPDGGTLRISAVAEVIEPGHFTGLAPGRYVRLSVER